MLIFIGVDMLIFIFLYIIGRYVIQHIYLPKSIRMYLFISVAVAG